MAYERQVMLCTVFRCCFASIHLFSAAAFFCCFSLLHRFIQLIQLTSQQHDDEEGGERMDGGWRELNKFLMR